MHESDRANCEETDRSAKRAGMSYKYITRREDRIEVVAGKRNLGSGSRTKTTLGIQRMHTLNTHT